MTWVLGNCFAVGHNESPRGAAGFVGSFIEAIGAVLQRKILMHQRLTGFRRSQVRETRPRYAVESCNI